MELKEKNSIERTINIKWIVFLVLLLEILMSGCSKNDDQWLYSANSNGVMKQDSSGKNYYFISNVSAKEAFVNNGWLYYITDDGKIKKTKLNTKQEIKIDPKLLTYRSNKDGKEYSLFNRPIKNEMPPSDEIIVNGKQSKNITVSDEAIFFRNMEDKGNLYKINTNGTDLLKISDDAAEHIAVDGQWIYYASIGDFNSIYRVKKDGSEKKQLTDDYATWLQAKNQWIYYTVTPELGKNVIYKIKSDGSSKTEILQDSISNPKVIGDWIYFSNNKGFFKVKIDGSNKQKL